MPGAPSRPGFPEGGVEIVTGNSIVQDAVCKGDRERVSAGLGLRQRIIVVQRSTGRMRSGIGLPEPNCAIRNSWGPTTTTRKWLERNGERGRNVNVR